MFCPALNVCSFSLVHHPFCFRLWAERLPYRRWWFLDRPHDPSLLPHLSQIWLLVWWPHGAMPSGDTHPICSLPFHPPSLDLSSLCLYLAGGGMRPLQWTRPNVKMIVLLVIRPALVSFCMVYMCPQSALCFGVSGPSAEAAHMFVLY